MIKTLQAKAEISTSKGWIFFMAVWVRMGENDSAQYLVVERGVCIGNLVMLYVNKLIHIGDKV